MAFLQLTDLDFVEVTPFANRILYEQTVDVCVVIGQESVSCNRDRMSFSGTASLTCATLPPSSVGWAFL